MADKTPKLLKFLNGVLKGHLRSIDLQSLSEIQLAVCLTISNENRNLAPPSGQTKSPTTGLWVGFLGAVEFYKMAEP